MFVHVNTVLRVQNVLHINIYNAGTLPLKVFKATLQPNEDFAIPSDAIAFSELEIPLNFTGADATENSAYITYTALNDC